MQCMIETSSTTLKSQWQQVQMLTSPVSSCGCGWWIDLHVAVAERSSCQVGS